MTENIHSTSDQNSDNAKLSLEEIHQALGAVEVTLGEAHHHLVALYKIDEEEDDSAEEIKAAELIALVEKLERAREELTDATGQAASLAPSATDDEQGEETTATEDEPEQLPEDEPSGPPQYLWNTERTSEELRKAREDLVKSDAEKDEHNAETAQPDDSTTR